MSEAPEARPGLRVPRWVIFAWGGLILGLSGFLWWAGGRTLAENAAHAVVIYERTSKVPGQALRDCLTDGSVHGLGLAMEGGWGKLRADRTTHRAVNNARKTMIDVTERGAERRVRFYSYQGKPMRESERNALARCVI
ncbi:MAG: hypothetical protein V4808_07995 [Pseudomonadota bacterium]